MMQSGRRRSWYVAGLPDHHDPLSGIGGAPSALSALTLRLALAITGLIAFIVLTAVFFAVGPRWLAIVCAVVALSAVVDIVVIARRKHRGEPG